MVPRVVDTAFLQHPPNPRPYSLSAFYQKLPRRRKVGDTLNAEVEPDDAVVSYQWYADGEAIEGETDDELLITPDMVGSKISVAVMDADGNSDLSDETEEVGVYEALEILSAEQVKKDQVYVTFSAPISEVDKITVTKGSADKTVSAVLPDDDNLGATLTMKDALATGTYTVTLTPADEDVEPSSVEFDAKVANKAARIEILGDYLVMKDTNFQEGYCFIKGYNEFDEPITLSGLTVTAAPSDSTQYDASTGKLTVKSHVTNQYAIIKQVTVYAQAMVDSKPVMDQKTLEVANIGYPAEVEFGEITKDGTDTPDISEGITINELNSGLYYIPILSVKDNYGNDMLAKDLNDLNDKNLLTTVPTGDTSLYFSVRKKGSVFTEKNGQIVVFLEKGNGKPGKFNFLMTSAGGQFEKEVNIIENPYINTLDVTLPDIYEYEETEEFGLVGHDQDGHELDLYDYLRAGEYPGRLPFFDQQNLTESSTYIDAGNNGTWRVQKFADKKDFKVTFVPKETVRSKSVITFVSTTASFKTKTYIATVGARGTSGYIGTELKSAASGEYDFNQNLRFFDANGKEMDRAHNEKYPTFVPAGKTVVATLDKDAVKALTDEKIAEANHDDKGDNDFKFYYVVSKDDKDVKTGVSETVKQIDGYGDNDGNVGPGQYYVFLIASQDDDLADAAKANNDAAKTRIIDSRAFYVSAKQKGDVPVSYTAKVSNKLYTGDKYPDDVEVKVDVTYRNGVVEKDFAASGLSLNGGFKVTDKNKISKGTATGDGTATVSVYLAEVPGLNEKGEPYTYTNDGAVATCTLTYSDDDPVGTSIDFKRETQNNKYGTNWKENETEIVWDLKKNQNSAITVEDGKLTMTNGNVAGDEYTVIVKDQYGEKMKDAKYYINGTQVPTAQTTIKEDNEAAKVLEIKAQSKGSEVSQTWRVNVPKETEVTAKDNTDYTTTGSASADTVAQLNKTLKAAAANTTPDIVTFNGIDSATASNGTTDPGTIVNTNDTLVIAQNATLSDAQNGTYDGKLTNNGTIIFGGDRNFGKAVTNNGTMTLGGDHTFNGGGSNTGKMTLADSKTITIPNGQTFTNDGVLDLTATGKIVVNGKLINNGTIKATGAAKISGTGTVVNNAGKEIDLSTAGQINMSQANTLENAGKVIANNISGYVKITDSAAITVAATTYDATTIVPSGVTATITNAETNPTKTAVISGTGEVGIVATATDLDNITFKTGSGTIKDANDTGVTTKTATASIAIYSAVTTSGGGKRYDQARAEIGREAKGYKNEKLGWAETINLEEGKYYYLIGRSSSKSIFFADRLIGDVLTLTKDGYKGGVWDETDAEHEATSIELWVSETPITKASLGDDWKENGSGTGYNITSSSKTASIAGATKVCTVTLSS